MPEEYLPEVRRLRPPPLTRTVDQTLIVAGLIGAREMLEKATTILHVRELRDWSMVASVYLRQCNEADLSIHLASDLKLRAERRLGEMLLATVRRGRPSQKAPDRHHLPAGIRREDSSRWQRLARIEKSEFDAFLERARQEERQVTADQVIKTFRHTLVAPSATPAPAEPEGPEETDHPDHRAVFAVMPLLPHLHPRWSVWDATPTGATVPGLSGVLAPHVSIVGDRLDYLTADPGPYDLALGAPPAASASAFLARAYSQGRRFAFLFPYSVLDGSERQTLFRERGLQLLLSPGIPGQAWFCAGLPLQSPLTFAGGQG